MDMFDALKELIKDLPKPGAISIRSQTYHPSKHWIRRHGQAIRATKRYFDGRQKTTRRRK
jgi:macrodomain Ter protein organizer (MatP/YcbG family)